MTYSAIPALRTQPELAEEWEPRFASLAYDRAAASRAPRRRGALCGMAMTEKQGGSDVRANTTVGRAAERRRPGRRVRDHRPQVVLLGADVRRVPRARAGRRRALLLPAAALSARRRRATRFHIQRLKDKLGNRSNASREVEFDGAWARHGRRGGPRRADDHRDGQPHPARLRARLGGRHARTASRRRSHHARHRSAFGKLLVDQPLMQNVLADLALESEAATIAAMRLARAYDEAIAGDEQATQFKRLANAGAQVLDLQARARRTRPRRSSASAATATSRSPGCRASTARRRCNSIWEGSGNVKCLDVLRAMAREPGGARGLLRRGRRGRRRRRRGSTRVVDGAARRARPTSRRSRPRARRVVERMALALQGSLLVRYGDAAVADAFCASRLAGDWGHAFGTLPPGIDFGADHRAPRAGASEPAYNHRSSSRRTTASVSRTASVSVP